MHHVELMPASFLYTGQAGATYARMASAGAYAKLRGVGLPKIAAQLAHETWRGAVCLGVGDGLLEDQLLRPLAPFRTLIVHNADLNMPVKLQDLAPAPTPACFDLENVDTNLGPRSLRSGQYIGTLLGYTFGNLHNTDQLLRSAGRWCDALVLDTPLAHPADPRLIGECWSSPEERAWLDAAQMAHHGAVWPVTNKIEHSSDGYVVRLVARCNDKVVELLRFRRCTKEGWQKRFAKCGWHAQCFVFEDGPPRITWVLRPEFLQQAGLSLT